MKQFLIAGGQIAGYLVAVMAVTTLVWGPARAPFGDWDSVDAGVHILVIGFAAVIGVAFINWLMAWKGRSRLAKAGWPGLRSSLRWFGIGTLVGLAMAAGMLLLTLAIGGGRFTSEDGGFLEYVLRILPLLGVLLIASLGEEWLFRGYPLIKLSQVAGRGWANVLMALVFSAAHWGGNAWNPLIGINIVLGSLVVGALRFTPGGIPAAWGMHFAWNSLQVLAGATMSGQNFEVPMVQFVTEGPAWLSGDAFGPEGSLGATASTIVVLVLLGRYLRRRGMTDLPVPLRLNRTPGHDSR